MTHPPPLAGQIGGEHRPGLRSCFGQSGSGKSFLLQHDVESTLRVVTTSQALMLDIGEDVTSFPPWLAGKCAVVGSANDAVKALEQGMRYVVVRLPDGATEDQWTASADVAAKWALGGRRGSQTVERIVAITEAHFAIPNKPLSGHLLKLITAWRKRGCAFFYDSQRPALVSLTLRAQTAEHNLFVLQEKADRVWAIAMVGEHGDELNRSLKEIEQRFARGDVGWHVRLGLVRSPPYPLVRA